MDFSPSPRAADLTERVRAFIDTEIEPVEPAVRSHDGGRGAPRARRSHCELDAH